MFKYACLNPISKEGILKFGPEFEKTENVSEAQGLLVRSASMHEMELGENLLAVARAGAGVNNIPL
ncbi:MAG TPA: 3-phosphoglycerate dehydrogenase, partial [Lachnospiraceae bacterium]|nr:3-phosphoglycerate dehydrogenase [Lachnospiraceae bacterium]